MDTVNPTETTPLAAQSNDTLSDQNSYSTPTSSSDNEKPVPEEGEGDKAKDLTHPLIFFIALTSGLLTFLIFLPYSLWLEPYLFPNLINDNSPGPVTFGIGFFLTTLGINYMEKYKMHQYWLCMECRRLRRRCKCDKGNDQGEKGIKDSEEYHDEKSRDSTSPETVME